MDQRTHGFMDQRTHGFMTHRFNKIADAIFKESLDNIKIFNTDFSLQFFHEQESPRLGPIASIRIGST